MRPGSPSEGAAWPQYPQAGLQGFSIDAGAMTGPAMALPFFRRFYLLLFEPSLQFDAVRLFGLLAHDSKTAKAVPRKREKESLP